MSEVKVGDGVTGKVVTLDADWSLNWHKHQQREWAEQEAAFQFVPAEHVAHLKHKTRADLRVEVKVTYATIGKFPWSAMMMQRLGDYEAMHTLRSGCEDSYRAACLAALNAAKEIADGE
jgi:hypothetical protein